ncbi:hypothetical protein GN157_05050 [Flavobacterium rakeshii]|uniref:DUF4595 domain-containing protein n=1 Tax=Flavobacterium rakeshii TaxID=1038845 RepID=A0A6N8H991_9FLAO|nr:hypothetical protein [Flavobacterium rakeshii]MUV03071.1 hypothetical protein [Flavobacterium rakeshii]
MKLRLFFLAAFVALASCSSDDSTDPVNENPNPNPNPVEEEPEPNDEWPDQPEVVKYLDKINILHTSLSGEVGTNVMTFGDNNKLTTYESFGVNTMLIARSEYEYNENGSLSAQSSYNSSDVLLTEFSISYDEQGRISEKLYGFQHATQGWKNQTITYTYEEDKIVASTYDSANLQTPVFVFTHSLNAEGKIIKIVRNEETQPIQEIVYSGNNISSITNNGITTSYEYDTEMPVYGDITKIYENQFAGNTNNMILFEGKVNLDVIHVQKQVATANYMSAVIAGEDNSYTFEYVFDEDGYPVERNKYKGMLAVFYTAITYKN